jgi:hypothetical protein
MRAGSLLARVRPTALVQQALEVAGLRSKAPSATSQPTGEPPADAPLAPALARAPVRRTAAGQAGSVLGLQLRELRSPSPTEAPSARRDPGMPHAAAVPAQEPPQAQTPRAAQRALRSTPITPPEVRAAQQPRRRGAPQTEELVRRHTSLERARNTALAEAGPLGHDRVPMDGRLGDGRGSVVGFRSADGQRGFRVDYDPDKGIHYNWFDWTRGNKGAGGRWGAEVFPGSREQYVALLRALQK